MNIRTSALWLVLLLTAACSGDSGATTDPSATESTTAGSETSSGTEATGGTTAASSSSSSSSTAGSQTDPSGTMSASESGTGSSGQTIPGSGSGGGGVVKNCEDLCDVTTDPAALACVIQGFDLLELDLSGLECVVFIASPDTQVCQACINESGATDDQCVAAAEDCF